MTATFYCCVASGQQHKQDLRRIYKREYEFSKTSLFTRMLCAFLPECIAPFYQDPLPLLPECIAPRTTWGCDTVVHLCSNNRPFAGSGHMVLNKLHWDVNNAVGLSKQRNPYQSSPTFLCFVSPTASFTSQCNLFRTAWLDPAKGLFHSISLRWPIYIISIYT